MKCKKDNNQDSQQELTTNEFIASFEESLLDPNLDLSMDIADLTADALGLIGFPLCGFFVKVGKTAAKAILSVREDILLQKTYATAQAVNAKTIAPEELKNYRKKLENREFAMAEVGRLIDLIDKSTEIRKCKILGNAYRHRISNEITYEQFYELTEALNRIFTTDFSILIEAYKSGGVGMDSNESYKLDRLIAVGLLENKNRFGNFRIADEGDLMHETEDCVITALGKLLCKYGLEIEEK